MRVRMVGGVTEYLYTSYNQAMSIRHNLIKTLSALFGTSPHHLNAKQVQYLALIDYAIVEFGGISKF